MNQHKLTEMSIYLSKHTQLVGSCLVSYLIQSLPKVGVAERVSQPFFLKMLLLSSSEIKANCNNTIFRIQAFCLIA